MRFCRSFFPGDDAFRCLPTWNHESPRWQDVGWSCRIRRLPRLPPAKVVDFPRQLYRLLYILDWLRCIIARKMLANDSFSIFLSFFFFRFSYIDWFLSFDELFWTDGKKWIWSALVDVIVHQQLRGHDESIGDQRSRNRNERVRRGSRDFERTSWTFGTWTVATWPRISQA